MKWKIKEKEPEYKKWFAWYPVDIGDYWVWLEYVERKKWYAYANYPYAGGWEEAYRLLND